MIEPDVCVVAAQHPSIDEQFDDFLDALRGESRYFGPRSRANPKPFPSLIDGLAQPGGIRLAAVGYDRVVAGCRIDPDGDVLLAVAPGRRGQGIGTMLLSAAVQRAGELGWTRLTIRSSRRSEAMQRVATHVGAVAVDAGRGRLEMFLDIAATEARTSA